MAAAPVAQVTARSARRRALLIGIAYRSELLTTHQDVDQYQGVLIVMYGYRPEDITVLNDDPEFPSSRRARTLATFFFQLRELRNLVADAAAVSGYSNQQPSKEPDEEDFQDEYLITIDEEIIIDNVIPSAPSVRQTHKRISWELQASISEL